MPLPELSRNSLNFSVDTKQGLKDLYNPLFYLFRKQIITGWRGMSLINNQRFPKFQKFLGFFNKKINHERN